MALFCNVEKWIHFLKAISQASSLKNTVHEQTISYMKMLAGCWPCYLRALANFLCLQCHELRRFRKCSGLRERKAMHLGHSQFQTKNKKGLTICFLSLKCFPWIPFVLSVNMLVTFFLRSLRLKCTLNNCLFLNRHIVLSFILCWSGYFLAGQRKFRFLRKFALTESHIRRHTDGFWCNFIFRMCLLTIFFHVNFDPISNQ